MGSKLTKGILFFYPYITNVLILAESRKKREKKRERRNSYTTKQKDRFPSKLEWNLGSHEITSSELFPNSSLLNGGCVGLSRKQVLGWSWKLKRCIREWNIYQERNGRRAGLGRGAGRLQWPRQPCLPRDWARSPLKVPVVSVNRPFLHLHRASADPWLENWGRSPGKLTVQASYIHWSGRILVLKEHLSSASLY